MKKTEGFRVAFSGYVTSPSAGSSVVTVHDCKTFPDPDEFMAMAVKVLNDRMQVDDYRPMTDAEIEEEESAMKRIPEGDCADDHAVPCPNCRVPVLSEQEHYVNDGARAPGWWQCDAKGD